MIKRLLPLSFVFILSACGGIIGTRDTPQIYVLQAPSMSPPFVASPQLPSLQIALPEAAPGLDTEKIAVLRPDGKLNYVAGARWPETLPNMLQALLVDAFEKSGRVRIASSDTSGIDADMVLQIEAPEFNLAETPGINGGTHVRVRLRARYLDALDHHLLKSMVVEQDVPADGGMTGAVAAFNKATAAAFAEIVPVVATVTPAVAAPEELADQPLIKSSARHRR